MLDDMASIVEGKVETNMADRYDDIKAWAQLPTVVESLKDKNFAMSTGRWRFLTKPMMSTRRSCSSMLPATW